MYATLFPSADASSRTVNLCSALRRFISRANGVTIMFTIIGEHDCLVQGPHADFCTGGYADHPSTHGRPSDAYPHVCSGRDTSLAGDRAGSGLFGCPLGV